MTLQQLSYQYQEQARVLHQRIVDLRRAPGPMRESGERGASAPAHLDLEPLHRESRQLAELTARYYDRGYHKNAYYTL